MAPALAVRAPDAWPGPMPPCYPSRRVTSDAPSPTDDARAFNLWGLLLLDAGDPDEAVERFREAVRVSRESDIRARAYTNWAAALYRIEGCGPAPFGAAE